MNNVKRRLAAVAVTAIAGAGALVGCGGDSDADKCRSAVVQILEEQVEHLAAGGDARDGIEGITPDPSCMKLPEEERAAMLFEVMREFSDELVDAARKGATTGGNVTP